MEKPLESNYYMHYLRRIGPFNLDDVEILVPGF